MTPPKFRGRSTVDRTWAVGFYIEVDARPYICTENEKTPVEAETVGMASTLPDKNGRIIFQHDVVLCPCSHYEGSGDWNSLPAQMLGASIFAEHGQIKDRVIFKDGLFCIETMLPKPATVPLSQFNDVCEWIGTIWDAEK